MILCLKHATFHFSLKRFTKIDMTNSLKLTSPLLTRYLAKKFRSFKKDYNVLLLYSTILCLSLVWRGEISNIFKQLFVAPFASLDRFASFLLSSHILTSTLAFAQTIRKSKAPFSIGLSLVCHFELKINAVITIIFGW